MAIPELELRRATEALIRFCGEPNAELSYVYKVRGNAIVLSEREPDFYEPATSIDVPFARFKYDPPSNSWSLQCMAKDRWHDYEGFTGIREFARLLAEVESDPTGIFLG